MKQNTFFHISQFIVEKSGDNWRSTEDIMFNQNDPLNSVIEWPYKKTSITIIFRITLSTCLYRNNPATFNSCKNTKVIVIFLRFFIKCWNTSNFFSNITLFLLHIAEGMACKIWEINVRTNHSVSPRILLLIFNYQEYSCKQGSVEIFLSCFLLLKYNVYTGW